MLRAPRLAALLLCLPFLSACRHAAGGAPAFEVDDAVAITVSNQSRANLLVYLGRPGERAMKLGSVNALDVRAFRVRQTVPDTEVYLFAMPLTRDPQVLRNYESLSQLSPEPTAPHVSAPFLSGGTTRVRWIVRDGQRLSGVSLR
jgi:hypothetical protein